MLRSQFDDLVRKLGRKLYRYAYMILRNQEEAEDAVQEVFIRLWKMGNKIDDYNNIEALAVKVTKNYCLDQLKKPVRQNKELQEYQNLDDGTANSPHEILEQKETSEILDKIIGQLPELYRNIIELKERQGLSYEEISLDNKMNINTLRVTLSRARKLIRDEFIKYRNEYRRAE